jgi:hypothetical protein
MKTVGAQVFDTDFTNKDAVIALANKLGSGLVVIKRKGILTYNIVHEARRERWDKPGVKAIHFTSGRPK